MEDDNAATLSGITGLSLEKSALYLKAFGTLESASNAFFDGREPAIEDEGAEREPPPVPARPFEVPPGGWYELIWGSKERIPPAWMDQDIKLINLGIVQEKNGPCGVLAAVNAVLLACCLEREGELNKNRVFSAEEFVDALALIVERCNECGVVQVALWKNEVGDDVLIHEMTKGEEIRSFMLDNLALFIGRGSLCLLVYSAVFSRGVDRVKRELVEGDSEGSLVVGPFWLCTSELLMLLITGCVFANVGAYNNEGKKVELPLCQVGLLSFAEVETGMPVADALKNPQYPIWLIHGGDHFTLLFCEEHPPVEPDSWFRLYFWNALPPGRSFQELKVYSESGPIGPAPEKFKRKWFKPRPGEIDEVIQAHVGDREKTDYYSRWRFEVILAVDDPEVKGKPRPLEQEASFPVFCLGDPPRDEEWRCAGCYRTRFKTMCFGMNKAAATHCEHCGKSIEEAGWTIYKYYKEMPSNIRKLIQRNFGAKILNIIRTKWPDAEITYEDDDNVPSC